MRDVMSNYSFTFQVTAGATAGDLLTLTDIPDSAARIRIYNMHATAIAMLKAVDSTGDIGSSAEVTASNGIPIFPSVGAPPYELECNKGVMAKFRVIRQDSTDVDLKIEILDGVGS